MNRPTPDVTSPKSQPPTDGANGPRFYFIAVFWGKEHREYFLNLCLASLLSPNNIPALENAAGSRVVVATTRWDWWMMRRHPIFAIMQRHIEAEPIFIVHPWLQKKNKLRTMSRCQKLAAEKAFHDRAFGVFLAPDAVLSDGSVRTLQRLAKDGRKVVLSPAVRFEWEGCTSEFKQRWGMAPGKPLTLPPRELMEVLLRNPHSETKRSRWDSPYIAINPTYTFDGPDDGGAIVHSFSWSPLLLDYASLEKHDTTALETWTLDGDYVHRNFPDRDDVHVVTDSDDVMIGTFTKESEVHFDLVAIKELQGPDAHASKIRLLRRLIHSDVMDPLKRHIFSVPVYWHSKDITPAWDAVRERAAAIIAEAAGALPSAEDEAFYHAILDINVEPSFFRKVKLYCKELYRRFVIASQRTSIVFYVTFRPLLRPVVRRMKETERGRKIVFALRGWNDDIDDVHPPG